MPPVLVSTATQVESVIVDTYLMNGCDRADQMTGYYNIYQRKTVKWWKKLFYFMIEATQTNACILHQLAHKWQSLAKFKNSLVKEMEELASSTMSTA